MSGLSGQWSVSNRLSKQAHRRWWPSTCKGTGAGLVYEVGSRYRQQLTALLSSTSPVACSPVRRGAATSPMHGPRLTRYDGALLALALHQHPNHACMCGVCWTYWCGACWSERQRLSGSPRLWWPAKRHDGSGHQLMMNHWDTAPGCMYLSVSGAWLETPLDRGADLVSRC